jgi:16S rRNA (cytosine967-C5)-methyltransferase
VRASVLEAYAAVREDGQLADRTLERILRRERALYSHERRAIGETLYALLRSERRLDFALFGRDAPPSGSGLFTLRLAALEVLSGGEPRSIAASHGLSPATATRLARVRNPLPDDLSARERIALVGSFPDFLAALLSDELGAKDALAFAHAMEERAPLTVRANTLLCDRDALAARLAREGCETTKTRLAPHGLVLQTRINVFALPSFKEGWFEVQDEGSQLLATLVGARPRERVVDACAGAGGKTLALAADMRNTGEILALDVDERRLDELRPRARRARAHNVRVRLIPEGDVASTALDDLMSRADRVLVDAPCTGLGTLRRNPDARYRMVPEDLIRHVERQRVLLPRFAALVRPGGLLVYATCSVARAENEGIVEGFLACGAPFRIRPVEEVLPNLLGTSPGPFLKLLPHRHGTDGFFAAVLERLASQES